MALTIGRKWPLSAPRADYPCYCDYCGAKWRRSQLRRDGAGLLVCPDEGDGADTVTLDRMNAEGNRKPVGLQRGPKDGKIRGRYDP